MDEPRFPADEPAVAHVLAAALPDDLRVAGDDGHHLARVRRLRPGEPVTAADGAGVWRPYVVRAAAEATVDLEATGPARREPDLVPGLEVAFALTKGTKPEVVVRQLTELGVDAIVPVLAERSVARPRAERAAAALERLRRVAREAAMQARRARLPDVSDPVALPTIVARPGLVVAERGGPDAALVHPLVEPESRVWTLLVGPEGGFSDAEAALVRSAPCLSLGAHVLRAETAAVAGAAILTARRHPDPSSPGSRSPRRG